MTYFNTSDNPSGLARTVTIIANDGTVDSAPATDTINVTPVNDPPVVTAGHTLSYTENQAATAFDAALTVSDVDSANLASATVQITGNYVNGQDVLGFTNQNGITGTFDAGNRHADADRQRHGRALSGRTGIGDLFQHTAKTPPDSTGPLPSSPTTAQPARRPRPTPSMSRRSMTRRSPPPAAR